MAKRTRTTAAGGKQQPLKSMEDEFQVEPAVQREAEKYTAALKKKNKASADFNGAKDSCIATMKDHGVTRVRIQTDKGEKFLTLVEDNKLKFKKVKTDSADVDEE